MSARPPCPLIHVAVGIVYDGQGRVLVSQRPSHKHLGGYWEFPGGKLEPGERARDALVRELREELALIVEEAEPLIRVRHTFDDCRVLLDVWNVTQHAGVVAACEAQPLRWVSPSAMDPNQFPASNRAIIRALRLPNAYPIIDLGENSAEERVLDDVQRLVGQGYGMIQLRGKRVQEDVFLHLARAASGAARTQGAELLINTSDPVQVGATGARGMHLSSSALAALAARPLGPEFWVGASCHTDEDLARAELLGLDFAVLGAVCATATHPHIEPMGWSQFAELADNANLPVFALGGVGPRDLKRVRQHGGHGVSGIRAFQE